MNELYDIRLENIRTLVLNADMNPLGVFPKLVCMRARDAIVSILNGNSVSLIDYNRKILCDSLDMCVPSVIVLKQYNQFQRSIHLNTTTLYYRDNGQCSYCGQELDGIHEVTFDHVVPYSKGGRTEWINVVCSCKHCNNKKGSRDAKGSWEPKQKPYQPSFWDLFSKRKKFPLYIDHESWINYLPKWEGEVVVRNIGKDIEEVDNKIFS